MGIHGNLCWFFYLHSALIKVRPGSLHMVTLQGGSIGSYGDHQVLTIFNTFVLAYRQVLIPDTMVSRRHAVVSFRNGKYYLKDLGSSNGTLVNDERVALDDEVEVGHGTVVQVMEKKNKENKILKK